MAIAQQFSTAAFAEKTSKNPEFRKDNPAMYKDINDYYKELQLRAQSIAEYRDTIRSIIGDNPEQRLYDMIKAEVNIYDSKWECALMGKIVAFANTGASADSIIKFAISEYKKLILH